MPSREPPAFPSLIDVDLPDLLVRIDRIQDQREQRASLLPEVLLRCRTLPAEPERVLDLIRSMVRESPESGRLALVEGLERGIVADLEPALVDLLREVGENLEALTHRCLVCLTSGARGEQIYALRLLCALQSRNGSAIRMLLQADVARLWDVEDRRVQAIARLGKAAVPAVIESLGHSSQEVRDRAEAVAQRLGPLAVDAVPALLAMPQPRNSSVTPSPALMAIGIAGLPHLKEGLRKGDNHSRLRAMSVLGSLKGNNEDIVILLLRELEFFWEHFYPVALNALIWTNGAGQPCCIPRPALPLFEHALSEKSIPVRAGAATVLAVTRSAEESVWKQGVLDGFGSSKTIVPLTIARTLAMLPDLPEWMVREFTSNQTILHGYVGGLGTSTVHPSMIPVLIDEYLAGERDWHIQKDVAEALVRCGVETAQTLIDQCLDRWPVRNKQGRSGNTLLDHLEAVFKPLGKNGRAVLRQVWQQRSEHLSLEQGKLLLGLFHRCGMRTEVVQFLIEHPSPEWRLLAAQTAHPGPMSEALSLIPLLDPDPLEFSFRDFVLTKALQFWFAEEVSEDWRERYIDSTLRVLGRGEMPGPLDLSSIQISPEIDQKVADALRQVNRVCLPEEQRMAVHILVELCKGRESRSNPLQVVLEEISRSIE